MPTGLCTSWEFDTDMQKFKDRHNQTCNFENTVMSFYQETRPECKIEGFSTSGKQKKIYYFLWVVIVITVRQCSKQWEVTTTSVLVKKLVRPYPTWILSEVIRERWMICDENKLKRKDAKLMKYGS